MRAVHQHFQNPPDKMAPTVVVLFGMGGCGKSQLALEYCRQGQYEKWFSAIFWLDASSPASTARSFSAVANELSKPNFDQSDDKGNTRYVLDTIGAWKIPWLFVFDNFDDPSSFGGAGMQQYFPRSGSGSILFTSRHAASKSLGYCLEVTTMSDKEALELLLKRSQAEKSDRNKSEAANIAKRLGYHALAIDQAGAYVLTRGLDLGLYMKHYSERKEKVLIEVPDLWDYRRKLKDDQDMETKLSVFTTWKLSIELVSGSPKAREDKVHLLTLAGFLDGKEVSDDLFECYSSENVEWLVSCRKDGAWDSYEVQDILNELENLSLVQNMYIGENETTISLHPLIQDWVKIRVNTDARRAFTKETILILSAYINSQDINFMSLSAKQAIQSHLEVILEHDIEFNILKGSNEDLELLPAANKFSVFLGHQGRYGESVNMLRYVIDGRTRVLRREHPETLQSVNDLALSLSDQGKFDEAEPMFRQTFQLAEAVLGKEHPNTLTSLNNLAFLLKQQGKLDEAEPLYKQNLQLREAILGKEHPDTLASMNNLATLLEGQGKLDEAELLYQQTLQLRKKVLGEKHPSTLNSIYNLADTLMQQGKTTEAIELFQEELLLCEEVHGPDHKGTLGSRENLQKILESQEEQM